MLLVAFVVYNELTLRSERGALATTTATPAPALAASPSPPPRLVAHPGRRRPELAGLGVLGALVAAGYG